MSIEEFVIKYDIVEIQMISIIYVYNGWDVNNKF